MGDADLHSGRHSDHPAPRGGENQDTTEPRSADNADVSPLRQRRAGEVCGVLREVSII